MTNKTITLTIPNDDPIALHEFGAAMQRMAGRHGLEVPQAVVERETHTVGDMSHTVERVLVDTDKAQLAALGEAAEIAKAAAPVLMDDKFKYDGEEVSGPRTDAITTSSPQIDSDGLPWDARIHASSKERNADDTWRARRKPSDMDAAQWAEYQGQVRTELRELMAVPVMPVEQEVAAVLDEPVEPTPVVIEPVEPEPVVVTPPPVVAPPAPIESVVPVAPPAPTSAAPTEFVPFLQWVTGNGYSAEQVNAALLPHGLTAVPQLQQRPDLIPQVYATLTAGV